MLDPTRPGGPFACGLSARPPRYAVLGVIVFLLSLCVCGAVLADPADVSWSSDFGAPGLAGINSGFGCIRSAVNWDGTVVVGGNITHAGGKPVQNVVSWNGTEFTQMGDGLDGTVTSLAVVGTTLYAAGEFTASGATPLPNVARWTGSAWAPVGSGAPDNPTELSLAVDGASLLLLGAFTTIDAPPVPAECIARWDGGTWSAVGGFSGSQGPLRAAARLGSRLYAGGECGEFCSLHYWDGSSWTYDFAGLDGGVRALVAVGADLYILGDFTSADFGNTPVEYVARWDGTTISPLTDDTPGILGMGVESGQLFVHGTFINHPGPYSSYWDGSGWTAGPDRIWSTSGPSLTAFARLGGDLFLAGNMHGFYDYTAGGVIRGAKNIAAWNGTGFRALGPGFGVTDDGYVQGLATFGGQLVAAGSFKMIGRLGAAQGIASWNGAEWNALGTGLNDPFGNPEGERLTVWNNRLVVTGYFTGAGPVNSSHIIAWNGSTWEGFNGGFAGQGARVVDYGTQLIAGGLLQTEIGSGAPLGHVARWTGSQWQTIGTVSPSAGASATKLAVWSGKLIAAGLFTSVNGATAVNIAQWDGTSWSALGSGLNGLVYALGVHDGDLYASGIFTASGVTPLPGFIARWNGSAWVSVGAGLDYGADEILSAGGKLFAIGNFGNAGGSPATRIASWDGTNWAALGSGLGQGIGGNNLGGLCLASYAGDLFVGGFFNTAGDKSSEKIARWSLTPSVAVGPAAARRGLALSPASRNPASSEVSLSVDLPADTDVEASVFDAAGRLVRRLASGRFIAGVHRLDWDGHDGADRDVRSGVYWIRVSTPIGQAVQKVIWMR